MSNGGVCRTAPTTPGLLNMLRHMKQKHGDTEGTEVPNTIHDEPVDTFTENNMRTFEEVL